MKKTLALFFVVILMTACSKKDSKLETAELTIDTDNGAITYTVENAATDEQLRNGLMYRDSLDANSGMIFDLSHHKPIVMWMKNTKIPLDMIFIGEDNKVVWIAENTKPMSEEYIIPQADSFAVIEVNAGDVKKNGIKVGDKVHHKFLDNRPQNIPAKK